VIEFLLGVSKNRPKPRVTAKLSVNLASQAGREEWVSVRLTTTEDGILAVPIFGKSNLIFTLSKGDGLIKIPADATGLPAGEIVDVWLM
jgi:molybdopterin molybdotransferase